MVVVLRLGLRNFARYLRRYGVLILGITLLSTLLLIVSALFNGARGEVRQKALRYFAGDYSLQLVHMNNIQVQELDDILRSIVSASPYFLRTVAYTNEPRLYANGNSAPLRRFTGVDTQSEPLLRPFNSNEILISTETADQLQVRTGDQVLLRIRNKHGAINTHSFIVGGVFIEGGFFAYNAYVHRSQLNAILGLAAQAFTDLGFYYPKDKTGASTQARQLVQELRHAGLPVLPLFATREERNRGFSSIGSEPTYAVTMVDAQLAQLYDLLQYMSVVVALFSLLFVLIMFVGILNSFQVIVNERSAEIGTMRAIGFSRGAVIAAFVIESMIMAIFALSAGAILAAITLGVLTTLTIPNNGWSELFTQQGKLQFSLSMQLFLIAGLASSFACIFGSLFPAVRAALVPPADALRS